MIHILLILSFSIAVIYVCEVSCRLRLQFSDVALKSTQLHASWEQTPGSNPFSPCTYQNLMRTLEVCTGDAFTLK